jgi:hypothetical protein
VAAAVAIQGSLDLLPSVRARKDLHQIDTSLGGTRYAPFFFMFTRSAVQIRDAFVTTEERSPAAIE